MSGSPVVQAITYGPGTEVEAPGCPRLSAPSSTSVALRSCLMPQLHTRPLVLQSAVPAAAKTVPQTRSPPAHATHRKTSAVVSAAQGRVPQDRGGAGRSPRAVGAGAGDADRVYPVVRLAAAPSPAPRVSLSSGSSSGSGSARPLAKRPCQTEIAVGGSLAHAGVTYDVQTQLGADCFAEVFKAEASNGRGTVAIKVLPEAFEAATVLFDREARHLRALKHPNIVRALDDFRFVGARAVYTCIVLEYCDGGSVKKYIEARKAPFAKDVLVTYARQLSGALAYMQKCGIVHGDLKSDNVLLGPKGHAKIADFGHSRKVASNATRVPMAGGDRMYAPPETAAGAALDPNFDMWGFGCILCEVAIFDLIPRYCQGVPFGTNAKAYAAVTKRARQAHDGLLWPLTSSLLSRDAPARPSASAAKSQADALCAEGPQGRLPQRLGSGLKKLLPHRL